MATQPKLAMIPSGYKDGKLYSVLPTDGVGDFDVTRGSNATRINKDGLIETVSGNTPRLDYTGGGCPSLLLEPQSRNLATYSEDFSNAAWNKVNSAGSVLPIITSNYGISPDGTQNADRIQVSRASGVGDYSSVYRSISTSNSNRGLSVWLKSLSGTPTILITNNNAVYVSQQITTEWVRYELDLGVGTLTELQLSVVGSNFTQGVSESADFLAWGYQLEIGIPTSYIPTVTTTITRFADTASGAGNASTFNDSEGVLMVEISALDEIGTNQSISISNGSISNRILFRYNSTNQIRVIVVSDTDFVFDKTVNISNLKDYNKFSIKYKENDFALWINGFELGTDNSGLPPVGLSALAFHDGSGINDFYGNTKQLQYYNTALTDSELETLTSYTSFNAMALAQNYTI